jgi:hypothetical protein
MHTVLFLARGLEGKSATDLRNLRIDNRLEIPLVGAAVSTYAAVQLHEALFHFHKAFYNYIAARSLYYGGMEHWINISLYYAKFFLARALTTLLGSQSYSIRAGNPALEAFRIAATEALDRPSGTLLRVVSDVDLQAREGVFRVDHRQVNSHKDVWTTYREIPRDLGVEPLIYADHIYDDGNPFGIPRDYLQRERNEENYSFDGYMQVDFNLPLENFDMYFERDHIKNIADTLYDPTSGDVLLTLSTLYHLLHSLNVDGLPLAADKLQHMVRYSMPEGDAKNKLLMLLDSGFDVTELHSPDGDTFYDQAGRTL